MYYSQLNFDPSYFVDPDGIQSDFAMYLDFRDFSSPDKLAAYCGLVPSVYQSAGKLINGHITKHGSPHIRSMIIEVAHAIIRTRQDTKLKKFFLRIKARRGTKIGVVALSRKVL
jgi:transposase